MVPNLKCPQTPDKLTPKSINDLQSTQGLRPPGSGLTQRVTQVLRKGKDETAFSLDTMGNNNLDGRFGYSEKSNDI
jgi:hypothetical protein